MGLDNLTLMLVNFFLRLVTKNQITERIPAFLAASGPR